MRPTTELLPKALIPVLGVPFVDWQLRNIRDRGVARVLISIGYRGSMIRRVVGDGGRLGVSVEWVDEGPQRLGTAGAIRLAVDSGLLESTFFVLFGDSYLPTDMSAVKTAWRRSGLPALMTVCRNDGGREACNAVYSSGRVLLYDKSGASNRLAEMRWLDYGLSILTADVVRQLIPPRQQLDLADTMRALSLDGKLAGYEVTDPCYEIGSMPGHADLEAYLRGGNTA